ncbi:hypothetical protein BC835DRAFT_816085 [Cytidiella melzeri]|nr:hypothetical protein BC835DRAFT_816085 [Cytidiella melzeri]
MDGSVLGWGTDIDASLRIPADYCGLHIFLNPFPKESAWSVQETICLGLRRAVGCRCRARCMRGQGFSGGGHQCCFCAFQRLQPDKKYQVRLSPFR